MRDPLVLSPRCIAPIAPAIVTALPLKLLCGRLNGGLSCNECSSFMIDSGLEMGLKLLSQVHKVQGYCYLIHFGITAS